MRPASVDLLDLLRHKALPCTTDYGQLRLVVAHDKPALVRPCEGVRLLHRTPGQRVGRKGDRNTERHVSTIIASWPQDELLEKSVPQLVWVAGGRAHLTFGRYALDCDAGCFIMIPAGVPYPMGVPHLANQSPGEWCDVVWFNPWSHSVRCWVCRSEGLQHDHVGWNDYYVFDTFATGSFNLLLEEIAVHGTASTAASASHAASCELLRAFLKIIIRNVAAGQYTQPGRLNAEAAPFAADLADIGPDADVVPDAVERARHYVRRHLHERLTLDKVARQVHLSRAAFTRQFRQRTGQSFVDYITACRLAEARHLLRESDWPILAIVKAIGFRSTSHFHSLFVRHTGVTPDQYRRGKAEVDLDK